MASELLWRYGRNLSLTKVLAKLKGLAGPSLRPSSLTLIFSTDAD